MNERIFLFKPCLRKLASFDIQYKQFIAARVYSERLFEHKLGLFKSWVCDFSWRGGFLKQRYKAELLVASDVFKFFIYRSKAKFADPVFTKLNINLFFTKAHVFWQLIQTELIEAGRLFKRKLSLLKWRMCDLLEEGFLKLLYKAELPRRECFLFITGLK